MLRAVATNRVADKRYQLAPRGQRLVDMTAVLPSLGAMQGEFIASGEGGVMLLVASTEGSLADRALRAPPEIRAQLDAQQATTSVQASPVPSIARQLLISPFKAAPFQEPATGLILMRDRWSDPSTGSFLTPDPEGYTDSSNPYIYCGGDPVNCSDPIGSNRRQDLKADVLLRREREAAARRQKAITPEHRGSCSASPRCVSIQLSVSGTPRARFDTSPAGERDTFSRAKNSGCMVIATSSVPLLSNTTCRRTYSCCRFQRGWR
jgi:RHS repeat-associated protein